MEKFKICPNCDVKNKPMLFECTNCQTDLTNVRVLDELSEKYKSPSGEDIESEMSLVRICDCGNINPAAARKCVACNEDISDITPIKEFSLEIKTFTLCSVDGQYEFSLSKPVTTIGREQEMSEYLTNKSFVSRTHAKFTIVKDEVFIDNLSKTNFTYVNSIRIDTNKPILLNEGDEIGLGGTIKDNARQNDAAYFILRRNLCT